MKGQAGKGAAASKTIAIPAVPDTWWSYLASGFISILFGLALVSAGKNAAGRKAAWALAILNLALTVLGFILALGPGVKAASLMSVSVDLLYAIGVLVPLYRLTRTR